MEIIVSVRDRYNTYTATFGSKHRASCTGGAQQAVERLAVKVFGQLQRTTVAEVSRADCAGVAYWSIKTDPDQACRLCGCTWDHGCEDGCYWIEADLCSSCAPAES
ncbi:MAG: hypothetical protein KJZ96_15475 [Rhodocyclaceae bacterium]|nr:hypothetical protein [Rhodocyclaceae bacterium]